MIIPIFLGIYTIIIFSLVGLETVLGHNFFTGFRQISLILVFFLIWLFRRGGGSISINYALALLSLSLMLVLGGIISDTPMINIFIGVFMTIEFSILFYLSSSTKLSVKEIEIFGVLFLVFIAANTFSVLIDYIATFPAALRQDVGVQGDAGFFASGLNIGVIILLGLTFIRLKRFYIGLATLFSIVIFLTAIKKAILINVLIWIVWILVQGKKMAIRRLVLISFVFLIAVTLSMEALQSNIDDNISYLGDVGFEEHVRLIMYIASFQIAMDYFPFGSGAGSFGSLASITNYFSPLYDSYGVSVVPSNTQSAVEIGAHTLLDTYWPHILAEAGFLGTFLMIFLYMTPLKIAITTLKSENVPAQIVFCAFLALCIPLSLFLEGFALYTPEAPSFLIFIGGICGYCYRIIKKYNRLNIG